MPLLRRLFSVIACACLAGCITYPKAKPVAPEQRVQAAQVETGDFAWGISTSSWQYENRETNQSGTPVFMTDWDLLMDQGKAPPRGNTVVRSWSDFDKDVAALKKIGATHYRFSLEWARIEPQPGQYDEAAIRRYVGMARRLKAAGIEPVVCLWHFTFPSWLYDKENPKKSNWLHPEADARWAAYVRKVVPALAPQVRYFAPQNEPNGQIGTAYLNGLWPPAMTAAFGTYAAATRASARQFRQAADIIKSIRPDAVVMSVQALPRWEHGLLDPTRACYNGMARLNFDHLDLIADKCDVIGFNYYYSQHAGPIAALTANSQRGKNFTMMGWDIDPAGLYKQIRFVGKRYGKPMMITENGIATTDDKQRENYIADHIGAIQQAKKDGYDVRGYFVWSLLDNYEWHGGYSDTFGLGKMNRQTHARELKPSAYAYRDIIRRGGVKEICAPVLRASQKAKP
ncbi:MAG: glycoside hydrolase family 1 protein [Chthoniobacterales bacterium]|nr:glycoside hydrolase family 1 protein [Chthoniobacterales bacterium]